MYLPQFVVAFSIAGCSSPETKAAKAQERSSTTQAKISERRLALVEDYEKCVEDAQGDKQKLETCDQILEAIEALK